jgi:hypothetical protein
MRFAVIPPARIPAFCMDGRGVDPRGRFER